jgi:uncharacterized protein (DUF1501 family)
MRYPITRRKFLAASGAAGLTLWLPRFARGEGRGVIRHVILIHLNGGMRWLATFNAADNVRYNPYGRLPWDLAPAGYKAHAATPGSPWPVGRIFHLRPLSPRQATFDQAYARLSSMNPDDYNFNPVVLSRWPGRPRLPPLCGIAHEMTVVSCDAQPDGVAPLDHGSAQQNLFTGSTSGSVGLATLFNAALQGRTRLPAVSVGAPGFALGVGAFAQSRPLTLTSPTALPTSFPGKELSPWAREYEGLLDSGEARRRPGLAAEAIANFALEKRQGETYINTLLSESLRILTAPPNTAFGQTVLSEPVQNGMLREVFGVTSADTPADDILHDAFASMNQTAWTNSFGLQGALAVRLLQNGATVVSFAEGNFDTHSGELIGPARTLSAQAIQLGRLLSGFAFALKNIRDPDTTAPLWDSTVVVLGSEFGRQGPNIGQNGFNTGRGSDHSREQFFPVLGGPLGQKGQLLADGSKPYHMNSIWTSLLEGMGAPSTYLRPDRFPPISGLIKAG